MIEVMIGIGNILRAVMGTEIGEDLPRIPIGDPTIIGTTERNRGKWKNEE